jgi:hypothetical protein
VKDIVRSTQCSNTLPHTLTDFSTLSSSNTPLTTLVEHLLQWATPQLGLVFIGRDSRRRAHTGWEVIDAELFTRRDSASAWHRAKVCARTMMLQGLSTSEGSEEGEESKEGEESEESKEGEVRLGWEVVPERVSCLLGFFLLECELRRIDLSTSTMAPCLNLNWTRVKCILTVIRYIGGPLIRSPSLRILI